MRKHYIDNLRWLFILILIPYHAAQAWNTWEEPNYIYFGGNRVISSFIVFFSPYYMPLLFLLAGISSGYALQKRTYGQYIGERVKRLLVPLFFGTLFFMPVMTWLADRFHSGYEGSLFSHYSVFFTRFTDLTGADGGFSFGQFWFLLYLFVISLIGAGIIRLQKRYIKRQAARIPFWSLILLGLPLPLLDEVLSVGGKSLASFLYIFLVGFYVFSREEVTDRLENYAWITAAVGLIAAVLNVYLFIWSPKSHDALNTVTNYVSKWFMLLTLLGLGKRYLDFSNKMTEHLAARSFPFFSFHFIWVVLFQYLLSDVLKGKAALLYLLPVAVAYLCTFLCAEICIRVPALCFLTGTKRK